MLMIYMCTGGIGIIRYAQSSGGGNKGCMLPPPSTHCLMMPGEPSVLIPQQQMCDASTWLWGNAALLLQRNNLPLGLFCDSGSEVFLMLLGSPFPIGEC